MEQNKSNVWEKVLDLGGQDGPNERETTVPQLSKTKEFAAEIDGPQSVLVTDVV